MVHAFSYSGKYFLFDAESGTLLMCDKVVYDIVLSDSCQTNFLSAYTEEELACAKNEIEELKKAGLIYTPPIRHRVEKFKGEIKALCLHICHDCNLACGYCFASQGEYGGQKSHMSIETARKAVDFLIANSGKRKNLEIDFFGGEPLLNFETVKMTVDYAKEQAKKVGKEIKFTMTTNALLLSADIIDYLDAEMDNVVVSIDGRRAVHDAMRPTSGGRGSFDIVLKNALQFAAVRKKSGKDYYIRGTYTAKNTDFSEDVKFLVEQGFDRISIEPVVLPDSSPLALNKAHTDTLLSEYDKLTDQFDECRQRGSGYTFFHFMIDLDNSPCVYKRIKACGAGCEYAAITPEGNIYPCHQFVGNKEFLLGNLGSPHLDENIRNRFSAITVYDKNDCNECFAKYHCSGGCFANSYHFKGDLVSHEPIGCILMRKRLECALYLYAKQAQSIS